MEVSPDELRARTDAFADRLHVRRPELDRDQLARMLDPDSNWPVDTRAGRVVDLAIDDAGLEALLPDDSVPTAGRWRQDLEDSRRRLAGRVAHGLTAAAEPEHTRDSLSTLSGPERGRDLADEVAEAIATKSSEYAGRAGRRDWSAGLSAGEAQVLDALEQEPPVVGRPAAVTPASKKVTALVEQVADVVNRQAGANSPVRQVGIDPDTPRGVRIAGPDAIVIGVQDHEALAKIGRSLGADKRFDETAQALAGVTEAVTDLAVRSDPAPPRSRYPAERGVWDRPLDRAHLAERAEHRTIQQAVTAASTDLGGVVAALAERKAVGQRFADLARTTPLPAPAMASVGQGFAEGIRAKLGEAGIENPPQARDLLAALNREPPEQKARTAADRVLAATVPEWSVLHDPPHDAALGRLRRQIDADFAALSPSRATAADGRWAGERAVATAVAIRAEVAPGTAPQLRHATKEVSTEAAFAGTTPLDSATPPDKPSVSTPGVADGPAPNQPERKW